MGSWMADHGFVLLQSAGIIGGLLFTALSLRRVIRADRLRLQFDLADRHSEIWRELFDNPRLARVLEPTADIENQPISHLEELFVTFLIHHLGCAVEAAQQGLLEAPEGLERDVATFFVLPIPEAVWRQKREYQSRSLIRFVERVLEKQVARPSGKENA